MGSLRIAFCVCNCLLLHLGSLRACVRQRLLLTISSLHAGLVLRSDVCLRMRVATLWQIARRFLLPGFVVTPRHVWQCLLLHLAGSLNLLHLPRKLPNTYINPMFFDDPGLKMCESIAKNTDVRNLPASSAVAARYALCNESANTRAKRKLFVHRCSATCCTCQATYE